MKFALTSLFAFLLVVLQYAYIFKASVWAPFPSEPRRILQSCLASAKGGKVIGSNRDCLNGEGPICSKSEPCTPCSEGLSCVSRAARPRPKICRATKLTVRNAQTLSIPKTGCLLAHQFREMPFCGWLRCVFQLQPPPLPSRLAFYAPPPHKPKQGPTAPLAASFAPAKRAAAPDKLHNYFSNVDGGPYSWMPIPFSSARTPRASAGAMPM